VPVAPASSATASAGAALAPTATPGASSASPGAGDGSTTTSQATGSQATDSQTARDESKAGSSVLEQFLAAVSAQDLTTASGLLAPDAAFQAEEVMSRVRRITLHAPDLSLVPDPEGLPHLALKAEVAVDVVAPSGSDLSSGQYRLIAGLRRESRRDDWRVWSFELQPR
jgi:hypothetical protein